MHRNGDKRLNNRASIIIGAMLNKVQSIKIYLYKYISLGHCHSIVYLGSYFMWWWCILWHSNLCFCVSHMLVCEYPPWPHGSPSWSLENFVFFLTFICMLFGWKIRLYTAALLIPPFLFDLWAQSSLELLVLHSWA